MEEVKYIAEPNYDGFVVIGAGLPRTGTNSLQIALSHLLKGPIHHMHVVHHTGDEDAAFWIKAADGKVTTEDWKAFMISQGYRGAVDFPAAAFYKELISAFPNAKVILTVRDPTSWYDSVKNSIYRGFYEGYSFPTWYYNILTGQSTRITMVEKLCRRGGFYGFKGVFSVIDDGKQASISYYNKWVAEVQKTVPAENLLVFNVKEGWPPLCHFLGLPQPLLPFPRTNDSNTKNAQYTKRKIKAYLTIVVAPILIGCLVFYYNK